MNPVNEKICVRIKIDGMVQGVGFRYHLRKTAVSLGLDGWVRNNADGTVTALAQGQEEKVLELVSWCRRGPSMAVVTSVEITEKPVDHGIAGFEVVFR